MMGTEKKITAAITGVGGYVPDYILDNDELSRMVDTNDEWIMTRIGIKTRHILKGEGIGTSYMGVRAVRELLEKTGTDPMEVDLVICATVTPDMHFPSTANLISYKCGIMNAYAFDMSAACSGFLFALQTGAQYVMNGMKKVVVVGADKMSSIVNYKDRATAPIFGDGAGAVLLEPNSEGLGVQDADLHSDGGGFIHLHMKAGGSAYPASKETLRRGWHTIYQEGQAVFKAAVSKMAESAMEIMKRNDLSADDIRYLVPHQANLRIIDATARRMGLSADKCMLNIQRYGNTTAATLPLCLWDYESRLRKGDNLIFAAFGGGYTWGALYLKWAYDGAIPNLCPETRGN
jgi:3-oxoacyl-[acyl-carrier-protein] synthase-3